jgi:hypothetical protein
MARMLLVHWEIHFKQTSKHGIISEYAGCLNRLLFEIKCCLKQNVVMRPIHITLDILLLWLEYSSQIVMQICTSYSSLMLPSEDTLPGYFGKTLPSFNHIPVATWFVNHRIFCLHWIWSMLAPFTGSSCQYTSKDAYGYFLSQMQI